jgi:ABC-type sugar transport system permease subunit
MIAPWFVGFILLTLGPMVASLAISFTKWHIFSPPTWVGLSNFERMYHDELFWITLSNTAFYTLLAVPLHLLGALATALLLNLALPGTAWFRAIYFFPSVIPSFASAYLWLWLFNSEFGPVNTTLLALGVQGPLWLLDPALAKPVLVLLSMWGLGGAMVIFLAGLQGIPKELYEAAECDGAGSWQRTRHVTLPLLTPITFLNLVLQIIGSFQVFTAAYLLTGGGPENSTLFYVLYLWRVGFEFFEMGYGSALAWVLFLLIMGFTLAQLKLSRQWVYYEVGVSGSDRSA